MIGYEICPFFIITSSLFSNDLMALLSLVCVCVFPSPSPVLHPPVALLGAILSLVGCCWWLEVKDTHVLGAGAGACRREMSQEGLEVGRRGSQEIESPGLKPNLPGCWRKPAQTVLCWPKAPRGPFGSLWLPLSSCSPVQGGVLSSPAPGCLGSVLSFRSLNLFIVSCNQSPSRREPSALKSL